MALAVAGCQSASQHAADAQAARESGDRISVGKVQREIRVGTTSAEVVEFLGSPNMVTTDDKRRESWVYDRISTERAYSTSTGGVNARVLGGALMGSGAVGGGGGGGAGYSSSAGASSTSQRTLTIIVKFDESSQVRDFAYHSSSFWADRPCSASRFS